MRQNEDRTTKGRENGGDEAQSSFLDGIEVPATENLDSPPRRRRLHLYLSVFVLNLVFVVCGTTFSWSSPMLIKLQLPDDEGSTVASLVTLGSVFGPFVSGALLNCWGRKWTMGLSMGLMTASYTLLTVADGFTLLALGRLLGGFTIGIAFSSVPLYVAEISEDSLRGILNNLYHISCCIGSLLMYSIGPYFSYQTTHFVMLGLCGFFFLLFPLLPESPHLLVMKGRTDRARDTLFWLRGNGAGDRVDKELQTIQTTVHHNRAQPGTMRELFTSRGNRRALMICSSLFALQQLCGIIFVAFYTETIFRMTGTSLSSSVCAIVLGVINTVSGLLCPLAVKTLGYRRALLVSTSGSAVGMGGLGVFFWLKQHDYTLVQSINWFPLLSLVVFSVFYDAGIINIPWAICGELFPSNVKPLATTLLTAGTGILATSLAKLFPTLVRLMGVDYVFLTCALFCCLTVAFSALVVQDTSGMSLAEIQNMMNGTRRKNETQNRANVI
uniref:Major facilitator superfamily (MFS) profile domain-containing protein n=1 Tax=Graphocephala atropunctata TaxID=36148 RepID=A0A1B6MCN5_9HEMI